MNVIRFYGEKKEGFIIPLPDQKIEEVLGDTKIDLKSILDDTSMTNFFEVFVDLNKVDVINIKSLDIDKVLPEALKAAKDHNAVVLNDFISEEKPDNYFTDKLLVQDVIDRVLNYGEEYQLALKKLNEQFALKTEWITIEGGSKVRKVEKPL